MVIAYFDSSALVKLLVDEPHAVLVAELWDRCSRATSSRLAQPEVASALAAAARAGRVDRHGLESAQRTWALLWDDVTVVELTPAVGALASHVATRHPLSGADAVHLASAMQLGDDVLLVTWDRRLHDAATAEGVTVVPSVLGQN